MKAIYALYPQTVKTVDNEAFDINGNKIEIDLIAVNAWVDPEAYKDLRQKAYPTIPEQLDILYHHGFDEWKAQIKIIKDRFPKQ
jgi:hypothetical protein